MRSVNLRFLSMFLGCSGIVGGVCYAVHGYQVQRNADVLLREADAARERQDRHEAISYLERYVALMPRDSAGPMADLGKLQAEVGRFSEAYRSLEGALRQDGSRKDVRRQLVEVALVIGRFPDARHHLTSLLDETPDDSQLLALLAESQAGMNEPDKAVETLTRAIELTPDRPEYSAALAELLHRKLEDSRRALTVLDDMVLANSTSAEAYVIRGGFHLGYTYELQSRLRTPTSDGAATDSSEGTAGDTSAGRASSLDPKSVALSDARKALELKPENEGVLLFAVRALLANDITAEAAEIATRGIEAHPKNPLFYGSLADVEMRNGRMDAAITWFERGLSAVPNDSDLRWNLAQVLIDVGRNSEGEKHLAWLRERNHPQPLITYLEARILINQGRWLDASQRLEKMRALLVEWPEVSRQADLWLGECYQQLGRPDLQLTAFRRAANVDYRWVPARLGVAAALLSVGRVDEALEEYQQLARLAKVPASVLAQLARLEVLINLRRNPKDRDWKSPMELLDRLEEIDPAASIVPILRAEILVGQGLDVQAEELLKSALDKSPQTLEWWLALAALAERRGDAERGKQLLDDARAQIGDSVDLRIAEARRLAVHGGAEAQDAIRALAQPAESFSEDEALGLYIGLAAVTLVIQDFDETERLCRMVAEAQPTNLRVRLLLFDLAYRAGRTETMGQVLDQLKAIEGSGPLWHYGEAVRLTVQARAESRPELYGEAEQHLTAARIARPGWSRVPLLMGHIDLAQGDEEAAIANYTEAVRLGERDPNTVSRAVSLLYQRRRFAEADQLIRRMQELQSPFSNEMIRLATDISLRLNDNERALSLVSSARAASAEPAELIWAGRVFSALNRVEEAEESFRKAIALGESAPEGWVALIQHLGRTVQLQKAEEAFSEAQQKIDPTVAPLALAEALESIGRIEDAEVNYKAALDAHPGEVAYQRRLADFYIRQRRSQDAESLLRNVLNAQESVTADDREWSRRNLAVGLMSRRSAESLKEALVLIDENLAAKPESMPDLRAKAMILAMTPERASQLEAVKLFESVLETERRQGLEGSAESRFLLAQLYLSLDETSKAISHLRSLLASHGNEPRYLAFYVGFLISRKEYGDAELWLARLTKLAPGEQSTITLTTDLQLARGRTEELLKTIDDYVAAPMTDRVERLRRTRFAAALLEKYARRGEASAADQAGLDAAVAQRFQTRAGELLSSLASEQPADALALAGFYGRDGRHADALDLLEKELDAAKPAQIAAVTSTLMISDSGDETNFRRAEELLRKAIEQHGRDQILVLGLADLLNWSARFAEAEPLYREALQKDSRNVAALNNLSVMLALQGRGGDEPRALIDRALAIVGPNPVLLDSRATIYLAAGEPRLASDDLNTALRRRPSAGGFFRLTLAQVRLGDRLAARESLQKSKDMGLTLNTLHPLERPLWRQLQTELQ